MRVRARRISVHWRACRYFVCISCLCITLPETVKSISKRTIVSSHCVLWLSMQAFPLQASFEVEQRAKGELLRAKKKLEQDINELEVFISQQQSLINLQIALDASNRANSDAQRVIRKHQEQTRELQVSGGWKSLLAISMTGIPFKRLYLTLPDGSRRGAAPARRGASVV